MALSLKAPIAGRPGRALPGALSPWSPDFPPAFAQGRRPAAVRPSGEGGFGRDFEQGQVDGGFAVQSVLKRKTLERRPAEQVL